MPSDLLTQEAKTENAAALASALGLGIQDAARALEVSIIITADTNDSVAWNISEELIELLQRTVCHVGRAPGSSVVAAEVVIGRTAPISDAQTLFVSVTSTEATIDTGDQLAARCAKIPGVIQLLIACYAAGAAIRIALRGAISYAAPGPTVIRYGELQVNLFALSSPVQLGKAYLAGAGAIGNGFLWALKYLDVRGELHIVDDDIVSSGNLNRQIWFKRCDIGFPKAERLTLCAAPLLPRLGLTPRRSRLQNLRERSDQRWLERLIVAVDSPRARRRLQNEFPREVFDASTTDIREIVIHHHLEPNANACLSCIYEADNAELSREQHIADHLGVLVAEVRTERISPVSAAMIANRFPAFTASALVGVAYDTLFKALCAEGQLRTIEGRQLAAPFAFVSVLAGTLLALEVVRQLASAPRPDESNYWRVSAWNPPLGRRRIVRPKQAMCEFCATPVFQEVNRILWE